MRILASRADSNSMERNLPSGLAISPVPQTPGHDGSHPGAPLRSTCNPVAAVAPSAKLSKVAQRPARMTSGNVARPFCAPRIDPSAGVVGGWVQGFSMNVG
jgi:hypothetical protein